MQFITLISFILYRQLKISSVNCLDETTIPVDMILYLSLYYLVNDLVQLPNPTIRTKGVWRHVINLTLKSVMELKKSVESVVKENHTLRVKQVHPYIGARWA